MVATWVILLPPTMISPYQYPRLYDIAYSWRDFRAECEFMVAEYERVHHRRPIRAAELACGPGNHARRLAAMGITTLGVDLSPDMLAYAKTQPGGDDPDITWLHGDMRNLSFPTPVDFACCLMDSLSHLLTLDEFMANLSTIAQNTTPNGLYILDQSHPRDAFGHAEPGTPPEWESEDENGDIVVETLWGAPDDPFNATTQIGQLTVTMTAYSDDTLIEEVRTVVPSRLWLAGELDAAVRLSGEWAIIKQYGAMDNRVAWQNEPPATRMVTILQKR